jgi:peptide/nickel transport system permease protein
MTPLPENLLENYIMGKYILRRLLHMIPVLLIVTLFVFSLLHLTPGDPAVTMLGQEATPEAVAALRARLGLDDPLPVQYVRWLFSAVQGDLGRSIHSNQPVTEAVLERLPVTVQLAVMSIIIALIIAIPVGIISAIRRNSFIDSGATTLALAGVAIPNFFLAVVLIYVFSVQLGLTRVSGYTPFTEDPLSNFGSMILPSITLGTALAAIIMRLTRSSLLEVLDEDYVRTARAKGLKQASVIRTHALKNALIPVVTIVGLQIGALLGGTVITETIFSLPGIGRLIVSSIFRRDFPLVQGAVLFVALAFLFTNLIVDLLYAYLDPRIRYE